MGGRVVAERYEEMKKGQAERLFPMLEAVLGEVGAVWEELDAIGVGTGPGNFTGIRIAVSAARGLSLSLDVPAVGVSGFEALLGAHLLAETGPFLVSLPSSRRGADVMVQRISNGVLVGAPVEGAIWCETEGEPVNPGKLDRLHTVIGHEANALNFGLQNDEAPADPRDFKDSAVTSIAVRIAEVAALRFTEGKPIARPSPLYIRPPDAAPPSDPPPVILS